VVLYHSIQCDPNLPQVPLDLVLIPAATLYVAHELLHVLLGKISGDETLTI
jgi:hypothetical protein